MTHAGPAQAAYRDGRAWRLGPHAVYRRFAAAAVAALDRALVGLMAADVGAGAGAMGLELAARGARVVYADRSLDMVREAPPPQRLVGDITALGLRSAAFDVTAAGFVLSHVDRPEAALTELARVTRPCGHVLATAFPSGDEHPIKAAVNAVLAGAGYEPPAWYAHLKETGEARVGDPVTLRLLAERAGLRAVRVDTVAATLAGLAPWAVVAWRLGMAPVAPFLAGLPAPQRARLTADAMDAVQRAAGPDDMRLLVLVGEAPP